MKHLIKLLIVPFAITITPRVLANDTFTFGIGTGSLYSGVGINAGVQSKTDFKYISVGCVSYSSIYEETCGIGIGWVKTDIFNFQTPKQGLSLYLGIVDNEYVKSDHKAVYGAGLGYHYFFNGMGQQGVNLGFTVTAGNKNTGLDMGGIFQLGYQF